MKPPVLSFACELAKEPLVNLFAEREVIDALRMLGARISLALIDLSDERAGVVRKLAESGIAVVAWLLLPEEDGYWFHAGAVKAAQDRYGQFLSWTERHQLHWAGLGIDLEPDIRDLRALVGPTPWTHLPRFVARAWRGRRAHEEAILAYDDLVARMRADGYQVEAYRLPMVFDERSARSRAVSRALGIVDVVADRDVAMLYTSFQRTLGPAMIAAYGPEAQAIGIGSTGGGVELPGAERFAPLGWEEFERDLTLALAIKRDIFIFSLEGCIAQGFLPRLMRYPWSESDRSPAPPPVAAQRRLRRLRRGLAIIFWIGRYRRMLLLLLVLPILLAWVVHRILP